MADLFDTTSAKFPVTPPRTVMKPSRAVSPVPSRSKSPADSGIWLRDSPAATPSRSPRGRISAVSGITDELASSDEEDTGAATAGECMPEDPFDSQQNRILFDAIDALQSVGAGDLSIPQLVIVGGQSAGKSSLLQSLTGIPFPVENGCCTRFPTRIVSRRTQPGTDDSFRITIDPAEVHVAGMEPASEKIRNYQCTGKVLTKERFAQAIEEISTEYMGLRLGKGLNRKNFVAEVLKVELSGPNRSYFSILDLPGTFQNASNVNKADKDKVTGLITEYMKRPDSIVICVCDAPTEFDRQDIFPLAVEHAGENRLVGVFTKCDMIQNEPDAAKRIVYIATDQSEQNNGRLRNGWFLVRNRADKDLNTFNLDDTEKRLFSGSPWNSVSKSRLGSAATKSYLGTLLSSKIRDCFPDLRQTIQRKLRETQRERSDLGEARTSHVARQQFVTRIVRDYEDAAKLALERPGFQAKPETELRREVSRLNAEFGQFMRQKGATWRFQDEDVDPHAEIAARINLNRATSSAPAPVEKVEDDSLDGAFPGCSDVQDTNALMTVIDEKLDKYQASQLDGVINPDIYPDMYRAQVAKWELIAQTHFDRVARAASRCGESILDSVCPPTGDTERLRRALGDLLRSSFDSSVKDAAKRCEDRCRLETKSETVYSKDPCFGINLQGWRQLRFYEGAMVWNNSKKPEEQGGHNLFQCFDLVHPSFQKNMVNDVHDVLKVYYQITITAFIRAIELIALSFISNKDGPILGLSTNRILGLSEEDMSVMGGENENTVRRRRELVQEMERLNGALDIVDRATRQTASLEGV
ncbi:hypothetical protein ACJ41O_010686 [Fusarium nematophilum]